MSRAQNNNNPGNLRPGAGNTYWDGQTGTDPDGFAIFDSKADGLAAARKQVLLDYNQHGLKTPAQLAQKYTKTDQRTYAAHLAQALGIGVNDDANLNDPAHFATYMGQLYGNEDAKASAVSDPDSEFGAAADLSSSPSQDDFDRAANIAPTPSPSGPDHFEAATGVKAPDTTAPSAVDPYTAALNAPDNGQPTLKDTATSAVNDILSHNGGASEIRAYFDAQNLKYDPKDIDAAIAAHKAGTSYTIPVDVQAPPSTGDELAQGVTRGARDIVGTFGDAAAWADKNIPGVLAVDNALGNLTGVQGNALTQQANADAIRHSYDQGPYANSLVSGAARIGTNIALTAPLIAGGEGIVAPIAADALPASAVEFAAGRGGTNLLTRSASLAARGATAGAEYGTATTGSNDDSLTQNILHGAETGAVLAPAAGLVASAANRIAGATAGTVHTGRAALAQIALDKGIPISLAQISTSPWVRRIGGILPQLPASGMAEFNSLQGPALTRAVSHTFGEDAESLTPDVIDRAAKNIGGRIEAIGARNTITDTNQLLDDLGGIEQDANLSLPASEMGPVQKQVANIRDLIQKNGGVLPGTVYNTLISKNGPLDRLMANPNGALKQVGSDIRDALDDAMEQNASPEDIAALRAARLQYKNLKTVEPLVANTGGEIPFGRLQGAVTRNFKNRARRGAGELGQLGDIAQTFLKPPNTSGTAENMRSLARLSEGGRLAAITGGALLGLHAGDVGAVGGALAGNLAGSAASIPIARTATRYLINQARVNRLVQAALDDNAVRVVPGMAKIAVPIGATEINRLREATAPK